MNKTIGITGANGFIGQALVKALADKHYNVIAYVRSYPTNKIEGIQYEIFNLEHNYPSTYFSNIDVLIHLAFNFEPTYSEGEDINIKMARFIQQSNIKQKVFVSSFAAAPPITQSYYGITKSTIESLFMTDLIIRPSLVIGNGGLYHRIKTQLQHNRFVPVFKQGNQAIQTIHLDDLINSMIFLIENNKKGIYHLSHPDYVTYKQFMKLVANSINKKIIFVPVPIIFFRLLIKLLSLFSMKGINNDNLAGILNSKIIKIEKEQKEIGIPLTNTETSIQDMAKDKLS